MIAVQAVGYRYDMWTEPSVDPPVSRTTPSGGDALGYSATKGPRGFFDCHAEWQDLDDVEDD